ncbi:MAG: HD domain-containing protein [Pseudomonadota bacterium]
MNPSQADALLFFLERAGALKDTMRSAYTDEGRQESTAAHSWRLGLWVIVLEPYLEGYDVAQLLKMAVLHDLGEAVTGDIPAIEQSGDQSARQDAEWQGLLQLTEPLDNDERDQIISPAREYNQAKSKEAVLLKGLDKLETLLQHATGQNPEDFDYAFNLSYGEKWTSRHPLSAALRARIDAMTRARLSQQSSNGT